jgi:hypothetical protein
MATKRAASGKKGATKKPAARKGAASKGASKKGTSKKGITFPPPNILCIEACVERYRRCLSRGVDPAICMKRLQKNLLNCQRGIFPPEE